VSDLTFTNLDQTTAFNALQAATVAKPADLLTNPARVQECEIDAGGGLTYNYAASVAEEPLMQLLQDLAEEQQLIQKYRAIASGAVMNTGEQRMVLHHLCRGTLTGTVTHDGRDMHAFYAEQQHRYSEFASRVRSGSITGPTGKPFTDVVQVGIGGSDLGPRALYLALEGRYSTARSSHASHASPRVHFISNVDPDDAQAVLDRIDPERSLFILVSKSGTTQETLTNEAFVIKRLQDAGVREPRKQIVCVTSETSPLAAAGSYLDSFFIDDFIGGRYSGTSAVGGVVLTLAFGPDVMQELLDGAHEADRMAVAPEISRNAALLDALIGVVYRNICGYPSTAILPYSQALIRFPAHLQQLDMESNGKRVNRNGEPVDYATGPVIFGEPGTNGQHSFYQLLHQGTDIIPLQFIGFRESQRGTDVEFQGSTSRRKLAANLAAQIAAFALGKDADDPNKEFPGNRPSTVLYGEQLTARSLGAVLAHYENKVMFQGLTWNLNSFDQEGVQLGKVLTKQVLGDGQVGEVLAAYARRLGAR
jgi:glucose-6-phosphate isomerase